MFVGRHAKADGSEPSSSAKAGPYARLFKQGNRVATFATRTRWFRAPACAGGDIRGVDRRSPRAEHELAVAIETVGPVRIIELSVWPIVKKQRALGTLFRALSSRPALLGCPSCRNSLPSCRSSSPCPRSTKGRRAAPARKPGVVSETQRGRDQNGFVVENLVIVAFYGDIGK